MQIQCRPQFEWIISLKYQSNSVKCVSLTLCTVLVNNSFELLASSFTTLSFCFAARAHSSVPYAWDKPTKPPYIKLIAPGGVSQVFDINNFGQAAELTYENFIYIAFVGTFKK